MSISHLKYEIRQCKDKINSNLNKIKKLEERIDELKQIKRKFEKTGEKLFDYKTKKTNSYEELRYTYKNTKFAVQCADDMLEYINGRDSVRAEEAAWQGVQSVQKEITKKEEEIEDLKKENIQLRNRIQSLEDEIRKERQRKRERNIKA